MLDFELYITKKYKLNLTFTFAYYLKVHEMLDFKLLIVMAQNMDT